MPLRSATKEDVPLLYEMVVELAAFEKLESEVTLSLEQFTKDFELRIVRGFVVVDDEFMYMNELLVRPEYRRKKYGKMLWAAVAKAAKEAGVSHISWSVLDWNKPAIKFYDVVPGVNEEKNEAGFLRYKMTKEGIEQMVAESEKRN